MFSAADNLASKLSHERPCGVSDRVADAFLRTSIGWDLVWYHPWNVPEIFTIYPPVLYYSCTSHQMQRQRNRRSSKSFYDLIADGSSIRNQALLDLGGREMCRSVRLALVMMLIDVDWCRLMSIRHTLARHSRHVGRKAKSSYTRRK